MNYNRFTKTAALLTFVFTLVTNNCIATSIPISVVNHSFEAPVVPMDGKTSTSGVGDDYLDVLTKLPTGWQVAGSNKQSLGQLTVAPGSFFESRIAAPPDSSKQVYWANRADTYLYQTLTATLEADMRYVLTVDLGDRTDTAFPGGVQVRLGLGGTPGRNVLAADSILNPVPSNGGWTIWENVYVTGANPSGLGQPLRIELISNGQQAQFDNVRLQTIRVPEPGALLMSVMALLGIAIHGRRRRRG